jgi:hypothetical protein
MLKVTIVPPITKAIVHPDSVVKVDESVKFEIMPVNPCMQTVFSKVPKLLDMYTFLEQDKTIDAVTQIIDTIAEDTISWKYGKKKNGIETCGARNMVVYDSKNGK